MDNKNIIITALGVGLTGGIIYYLSKFLKSEPLGFSRDQVLKMIKEYKRASLRVFVQTAEIVKRIKDQNGGKDTLKEGITIKDVVKDNIMNDLIQEREYIAKRYNISLEQFDNYYSIQYGGDKEIQEVCNQIQKTFENSLLGIPPSLEVSQQVKEKFSEDKVIEMQKKILKAQSKQFNNVFKDIKQETQQDHVDIESDLFKQKIRDLDIHQLKTDLLKKEGFEFEPESPCETFEKLSFQYKKTSKDYEIKLSQVINIYNKIKSDMLYSKVDDTYIDMIFN
ncbi:transmembrane protein, putative (macronuclear) [Tetrahymena thermophila SB210]|uniref:Transmembrane protein, putative n=1 Tax=Tetrahymena thermophila (strain SB210) TaxID=312017 RepID=Q23AZ0_TETTS|nr:transmembrane protein, putative [Tetrahymena thermophila SB210]EAR93694.1 transmembrane protein, putative [Tetrahymena thermophila SB210]|eukprot:XP_001013939.1 transmembrane protein, putative [Tetrahymena thermophila SB210]